MEANKSIVSMLWKIATEPSSDVISSKTKEIVPAVV